jgi:putative transposase
MPWNKTCPMEERLKFIADWLKKDCPVADLSRSYGISRKTAYKWIRRYALKGLPGLDELSRAPKTHPQATPPDIEKEIVDFRQKKPYWGPRKLLHRLKIIQPETPWPCVSTLGEILKRHGLTKKRRLRRYAPPATARSVASQPNDVWTADFKGWFRTTDLTRVDPLTVADQTSRFLLGCEILVKPNSGDVQDRFEHIFRTYGLPRAIRTDNGWPFATLGLGGLSRLSVWWIRLGILPERIRPAHPEENGSHERMHRTLKEQLASFPAGNPSAQQISADRFRDEFNTERPHEALEMRTPHEGYSASPRPFPEEMPEMTYGSDFQIRQVRPEGLIKWRGRRVYVSETLIGEPVGVKALNETVSALYFGPIPLALYDLRENRLHKFERAEGRKV